MKLFRVRGRQSSGPPPPIILAYLRVLSSPLNSPRPDYVALPLPSGFAFPNHDVLDLDTCWPSLYPHISRYEVAERLLRQLGYVPLRSDVIPVVIPLRITKTMLILTTVPLAGFK
jgi:hypothetical protein